MTKENIELLARPVLHMTIWGVAPREIMGNYAFSKIKKQVQAEANHHCMICDRYIPHTRETGDWIYTHEVYHVDKKKKRYTLEKFVGICKECHEYIHIGRLNVLYQQGIVPKSYVRSIVERGNQLLNSVGLEKKLNDDLEDPYYMEYEGKRFMNDTIPKVAKTFHKEGGYILHYSNAKKIDEPNFYFNQKKK